MTKRTCVFLAVAGLFGALVVLLRLPGAGAQKAPPPPTSMKAYVNLGYVVKNYQKCIDFTAEMKELRASLERRAKEKTAAFEEAMAKWDRDRPIDRREKRKLEQEFDQLQRELDDMSKEYALKSEEQNVILNRDVQEVVQRYATVRGYERVLYFNEAMDSTSDYFSPQNVARIRSEGPLVDGLDISGQIVHTLNAACQPKKKGD